MSHKPIRLAATEMNEKQQEVQRRAGPIRSPAAADWLPTGTRLHLLRRVFVLAVGGEVCSGHLDPSTGLSAGIRFGPWIRPGPLVRSGCASSEILTQVFNVSQLPTFHLHPIRDGSGNKENIPQKKNKQKPSDYFGLGIIA